MEDKQTANKNLNQINEIIKKNTTNTKYYNISHVVEQTKIELNLIDNEYYEDVLHFLNGLFGTYYKAISKIYIKQILFEAKNVILYNQIITKYNMTHLPEFEITKYDFDSTDQDVGEILKIVKILTNNLLADLNFEFTITKHKGKCVPRIRPK